ncbi:MAG: hypothetical protein EPN25_02640 [Nitrospirae bacterium]|nr:MAG: hypothetical protein EPN25_02640 [Nitrospirota bacterium]
MSDQINISGNPIQYDFSVSGEKDVRSKRMISLQFNNSGPAEVFLNFGESTKIEFGSADGDSLELYLPDAMLNDILFLLSNWTVTHFTVAYKNSTKEIVNFNFSSVKK